MKPVPHVCPSCGAALPSAGTGVFTCKQCGSSYRIEAPVPVVRPVQAVTYVTNNYHAAPAPAPRPAPAPAPYVESDNEKARFFFLMLFMISAVVTVAAPFVLPWSWALDVMMYASLTFAVSGLIAFFAP